MDHRPKYWIITASREHVRKGVQGGFAQACHGKSAPLRRLNAGDYVIYYSSKTNFNTRARCQEFTAIGKVESKNIYQVEVSPDFCPHRIDIEFYASIDVSILPLIHDLNFIVNKQRWGYPFRWGILQIDEYDFKLISNKMRNDPED